MSRARDLADSADKYISGTFTADDITVSGTVDGRDVSADGTKLDGIESGATTDQTGAEIKTAYEAEADTNAYTDAEKTKLSGIESGATGDQTAAEILTAIKTVDGSGSGLDADTLDGQQGSYYYAASNPSGYTTYSANQSLDTTSSPTFSTPNLTSGLRMGGTQVLSSSRALTNISSIDTTTKNAISNAGVGGATSLIQNWTNLPTNSSGYTLSLSSSYDIIRFYFKDVGTTGQRDYSQVRVRLNAGGSPQTSSKYAYRINDTNSLINFFRLGDTNGTSYSQPAYFSGYLEVRFHADSSRYTQFEWRTVEVRTPNSFNIQETFAGFGHYHQAQAHNGIYLYSPEPSDYKVTGGQYLAIGVNV